MTQPENPIACSLGPTEMARRQQEARDLAREALVGRERRDGGVRLEYRHSDAVEAAVRDLVRRERECCPFLDLRLEAGAERITVDISAPPDARAVLDAIYEASAAGELSRAPVRDG